MRFVFVIVTALGVFAGGGVASAFPTCAQNYVASDCGGCGGFVTSTDPTGLVGPVYCTITPWQAGQPCPNACYDLPHGRVEAHQALQSDFRCYKGAGIRDTLRLAGEESPDPISFEAVYLVQCTTFVGGQGQAHLLSPGNGQHRIYDASRSEEVVFPVTLVPGDALEIRFAASATNGCCPLAANGVAGADISVELRFRGLPANYRMLSCSGITAPVPAPATSWGSVKALYR
jgi:hypothetical protein